MKLKHIHNKPDAGFPTFKYQFCNLHIYQLAFMLAWIGIKEVC